MWWMGALIDPLQVQTWDLSQWQYVMRQSRRMRLFGRLAEGIALAGLESTVPSVVKPHLAGERHRSRARLRALKWVIDQTGQALNIIDAPRVLLKGAAYVAQDLPIAAGRLPSDLDILVPKAAIEVTLQRLKDHDWVEADLDAHDRRYYREWSHELPPMHNGRFELELDVHHGILPPIARSTVPTEPLLDRLMPSGVAGWWVLCPADQVLHSAAHLFFDSELRDRARDLVDLEGMFRHFSQHSEFWVDLLDRANRLQLREPLFLAVHFCSHWLGTPVPAAVRAELYQTSMSFVSQTWLLPLLTRALTSPGPDEVPMARQRLADLGVLVRYHLWRLPLRLLIPHLWHKSGRRPASQLESDDRA